MGFCPLIDGAQAAGRIDVDVNAIGCDAYIGTGTNGSWARKAPDFAYIRKGSASLIHPAECEQGLRFVNGSTGVGSLPLIIGLGEAARAMKAEICGKSKRQLLAFGTVRMPGWPRSLK